MTYWNLACKEFKTPLRSFEGEKGMEKYFSLHYFIGQLYFDPSNPEELEAAHELAILKATSLHPDPYESKKSEAQWQSKLYFHDEKNTVPEKYQKYFDHKTEREQYGIYLPDTTCEFSKMVITLANVLSEEEKIAREKQLKYESSYLYLWKRDIIGTLADPQQQPIAFFILFVLTPLAMFCS